MSNQLEVVHVPLIASMPNEKNPAFVTSKGNIKWRTAVEADIPISSHNGQMTKWTELHEQEVDRKLGIDSPVVEVPGYLQRMAGAKAMGILMAHEEYSLNVCAELGILPSMEILGALTDELSFAGDCTWTIKDRNGNIDYLNKGRRNEKDKEILLKRWGRARDDQSLIDNKTAMYTIFPHPAVTLIQFAESITSYGTINPDVPDEFFHSSWLQNGGINSGAVSTDNDGTDQIFSTSGGELMCETKVFRPIVLTKEMRGKISRGELVDPGKIDRGSIYRISFDRSTNRPGIKRMAFGLV